MSVAYDRPIALPTLYIMKRMPCGESDLAGVWEI